MKHKHANDYKNEEVIKEITELIEQHELYNYTVEREVNAHELTNIRIVLQLWQSKDSDKVIV